MKRQIVWLQTYLRLEKVVNVHIKMIRAEGGGIVKLILPD